MLFMGEEWGALTPFQFFTSHEDPQVARATAEGRKAEFAEHGWDADEIPDPRIPIPSGDPSWTGTKLRRARPSATARRLPGADRATRRSRSGRPWLTHLTVDYDEDDRWIAMRRGRLALICNLGEATVEVPVSGEPVLAWGSPSYGDQTTRLPGHAFAVLRT